MRLRRIILLAFLFAARTARADHVATYTAGDTVRCDFTTATSVATALSSGAVTVLKDGGTGSSTAGVTLTASRNGVTGFNNLSVDLSADGSFYSTGHYFDAYLSAGTVGGASVIGYEICSWRIGVVPANVAQWLGSAPNALLSGRVDASVGAYPGNTPQTGDAFLRLGAPSGASIDADILTRLATSGYTAPLTAGQTANALWDELTSAHSTSGSFGKLLKDDLDAAVSTRLAASSYTAPLSAGATENAVWDAALASHATAGTAGKKLTDIPTSGGGATAAQVWDYLTASMTTTNSVGAYLLAQLQRLSSTPITLASIVTADDVLRLVPGTAYTGTRQPKVPFTIDNTWDLTSATPKLVILDGDTSLLSVTGTVTAPGTTAQLVQFSLTAAQTALLTRIGASAYTYQVSATWVADGTVLPVVMVEGSVDTLTRYY